MRNVLVTGGCGFVGSNFIKYFLTNNKNCKIINLDNHFNNMMKLGDNNFQIEENMKRYVFIQGDITNINLLKFLFKEYDISDVIHFAEDNEEKNRKEKTVSTRKMINTNIYGTTCLLDVALKTWMKNTGKINILGERQYCYREKFIDSRFHYISTSEVYGMAQDDSFGENHICVPTTHYVISKISSEMIAKSYHDKFGMNVTISRCSKNYGEYSIIGLSDNLRTDNFINNVMMKLLQEKSQEFYSLENYYKTNLVHVLDHCKAIELILKNGKPGEIYNIGGNEILSYSEIINMICDFLDKKKPRKDDKKYSELIYQSNSNFRIEKPHKIINIAKIKKDLKWKPTISLNKFLEQRLKWSSYSIEFNRQSDEVTAIIASGMKELSMGDIDAYLTK